MSLNITEYIENFAKKYPNFSHYFHFLYPMVSNIEIQSYFKLREKLLSKFPNGMTINMSKDFGIKDFNFDFHFNFNFFDDAILYNSLINHRVYEEDTTNFFINNLNEDSNFLDVGVNIGWYTMLAASISKKGKIIGIEANPTLITHIQENIKLNNFDNVTLYNNAAWDKDEILKLNFSEEVLANGSIIDKNFKNKVDVKGTPLDKLLKGFSFDLVKMDIEGSEAKAIKGFHETLEMQKPMIVVEFNYGYDIPSLINAIPKFYKYYTLDSHGNLKSTTKDYLLTLKNTTINVLLKA